MLDPVAAAKIQGGLKMLVIATVVLYMALFGVVGFVFKDATDKRDEIKVVAVTTSEALCSLRRNIQRQIAASEEFLVKNPNGIAGVPAKLIQDGIDRQKVTVKSLQNLECPAFQG